MSGVDGPLAASTCQSAPQNSRSWTFKVQLSARRIIEAELTKPQ
jgi:hypothetical protein